MLLVIVRISFFFFLFFAGKMSELLRDFLHEKGLDPSKWIPLLNARGIQNTQMLKFLKINDIEECATKEEISVFQEIWDASKQLSLILKKAGLDPSYWLPLFRSKLHVESVEAFKKLNSNCFNDLEKFITRTGDREILKRLFAGREAESIAGESDVSIAFSSYSVVESDSKQTAPESKHLPSNLEDSFVVVEDIETLSDTQESVNVSTASTLLEHERDENEESERPVPKFQEKYEMKESGFMKPQDYQGNYQACSESNLLTEANFSEANDKDKKKQGDPSKIFDELLNMLSLTESYPQKLTTVKSKLIQEMEIVAAVSQRQLPHFILQMIMILNCESRASQKLHCDEDDHDEQKSNSESNSDSDSDSDIEEDDSVIHPMDGLLAVIHCCDNLLRQILYSKMATCQLSVPLLLPDPKQGTVTLMLWAMRSIVNEWKRDKSSIEGKIVDCKAPIVSFMRFGKLQRFSKSQLLSNILSDHAHFFHWNLIEGSDPKRRAVDGLVDICWYLPSGQDSDSFPTVVSFANLHGDCSKHHLQREFLAKASDVNFVLVSHLEGSNQSDMEMLQSLSQAPAKLVFVALNREVKKEAKKLFKNIDVCFNRQKTERNIKRKWKQLINSKLENIHDYKCLSDCEKIAEGISEPILIDENDAFITGGKIQAYEVRSLLKESSSTDDLIPLQGKELWGRFVEANNELHRLNKHKEGEVESYREAQQRTIDEIRRKQCEIIEKLNPNCCVLKFILYLSSQEYSYFLQNLKLMLENYEKGQIIGLEHLFRETGQMYEAKKSLEGKAGLEVLHNFDLPDVAAKLLIDGYPLELMDGDTTHVPITWVKAVINEVVRKLNDPKVFVLSILGVQSSGKSTLLNTMFGIQFKVSAGRCTRGAFLQLLPIEMSELKCDYILVVDTEGLHAHELDDLSNGLHKRDNEIATFIIGLADITIVNIKGEVAVHMDDILQTAVHAFLRMKKVKLNPRVLFVHQNVQSLTAMDKGAQGRRQLLTKLDRMTRIAAEVEECEELYKTFNDIITFNTDTDIFLFPNLWGGDPPMAPVNPSYSKSAQQLKTRVLGIVKEADSHRPFSKFNDHMSEIWEAILYENFVFSFKNSLELFAYKTLEVQINKWTWNLKKQLLEWKQKTKNIITSSKQDELDKLESRFITEVDTIIQKEWHDSTKEEMEKFFQRNEQRDILIQWRQKTEQKLLIYLTEEYTAAEHKYCRMLIAKRKQQADAEKVLLNHQQHILEHVSKLVSELESPSQTDESVAYKLNKTFDEKWSEWMEELTQLQVPQVDQYSSIRSSIAESLKSQPQLSTHPVRLNEKFPLEPKKDPKLDVIHNQHIVSSSIGLTVKKMFKRNHNMPTPQEETDHFIAQAKSNIEKWEDFVSLLIDELFQKIFDDIDESKNSFSLQYKIDLAIEIGQYALYSLKLLAEEAKRKNDPKVYFNKKKEVFFRMFCDKYRKVAKCKQNADLLLSILKESIVNAVLGLLDGNIVDEMKCASNAFTSKRLLKAKVLRSLVERKESFESFFMYITDVKESLKYWVGVFVEDYCKETVQGSESSTVEKLVDTMLHDYISHLSFAVSLMKTVEPERRDLNFFHTLLTSTGKVSLDFDKTSALVQVDMKDFEEFIFELEKGIKEIEIKIPDLREKVLEENEWKEKAAKLLTNDLIGCCAQCPFCKEQCDKILDHADIGQKDHATDLHRQECLGSYRFIRSQKMVFSICTTSVAGKESFRCKASNDKLVRYDRYRTIYRDWKIIPNTKKEASKFWKWFVATHSKDIATAIKAKEAEIPREWLQITEEEALETLTLVESESKL